MGFNIFQAIFNHHDLVQAWLSVIDEHDQEKYSTCALDLCDEHTRRRYKKMNPIKVWASACGAVNVLRVELPMERSYDIKLYFLSAIKGNAVTSVAFLCHYHRQYQLRNVDVRFIKSEEVCRVLVHYDMIDDCVLHNVAVERNLFALRYFIRRRNVITLRLMQDILFWISDEAFIRECYTLIDDVEDYPWKIPYEHTTLWTELTKKKKTKKN